MTWCGGNMRTIAFITEGVQIRRVLEHRGVATQPPRIAPARGPLVRDGYDAQDADGEGQGGPINPYWEDAAQLASDDALDQRTEW